MSSFVGTQPEKFDEIYVKFYGMLLIFVLGLVRENYLELFGGFNFMPIFAWTIKSLFWFCSLFDLKIVFEKSMMDINFF
jgi:hypothetical protein